MAARGAPQGAGWDQARLCRRRPTAPAPVWPTRRRPSSSARHCSVLRWRTRDTPWPCTTATRPPPPQAKPSRHGHGTAPGPSACRSARARWSSSSPHRGRPRPRRSSAWSPARASAGSWSPGTTWPTWQRCAEPGSCWARVPCASVSAPPKLPRRWKRWPT